jgi:hypothetical protein
MNTIPTVVFMFFITSELAQKPRLFVPGKPLQPSVMEHSSVLGPFISYKENEVLWILPQELYSQLFMFFITYEWAQ